MPVRSDPFCLAIDVFECSGDTGSILHAVYHKLISSLEMSEMYYLATCVSVSNTDTVNVVKGNNFVPFFDLVRRNSHRRGEIDGATIGLIASQ